MNHEHESVWDELFTAAKKKKNLSVITGFIGEIAHQQTIYETSVYDFAGPIERAAAADIAIALVTEAARGSGGLYDQMVAHIGDSTGEGLRSWLRNQPDKVADFFTGILFEANAHTEEIPSNFNDLFPARYAPFSRVLSQLLHDLAM